MSCTSTCHRPTAAQAHCGSCHRTFRNVSWFDAHRRDGACLDPATLGLVEVRRVWATPEGHTVDETRTARLRDADSRRPHGREAADLPGSGVVGSVPAGAPGGVR